MANLEREEFARYLNTTFRLPEIDPPLDLKLIEVSEIKRSPRQERFSLLLSGSKEMLLRQGTHQFNHPEMGDFEMFIVPIREDHHGYYYQAIFNRLVEEEGNAK